VGTEEERGTAVRVELGKVLAKRIVFGGEVPISARRATTSPSCSS
jgi:hypothetical protein